MVSRRVKQFPWPLSYRETVAAPSAVSSEGQLRLCAAAVPHGDAGDTSRRLIAYGVSPESRRWLSDAVGGPVIVVFCSEQRQFLQQLDAYPNGVILWELLAGRDDASELAQQIVLKTTRGELLVRAVPTAAACRDILTIAKAAPHARVSLDTYENLRADITDAMNGHAVPGPELVIARRIVDGVAPACAQILIAAAIAARRRISVTVFANLCQLPVRTLEWRLAHAGLVQAKHLLDWVLALHVVWNLDVLSWPTKRAASVAGFVSSNALSEFLGRRVGQRPRQILERGGYQEVLRRCIVSLQRTDD